MGVEKRPFLNSLQGSCRLRVARLPYPGKKFNLFPKLEKAKKMAVLTQEVQVSFDYTVEEIISLGRYPHQKGFFKQLSKEDRKVIEEVMDITKVSQLSKSSVPDD